MKTKNDPCRFWCRDRWGIIGKHPEKSSEPLLMGMIHFDPPIGGPALYETRDEARFAINIAPWVQAAGWAVEPAKVRVEVRLATGGGE